MAVCQGYRRQALDRGRMIRSTSEIEKLIDEIANNQQLSMNIYLIGGGALLYLKSKQMTKDIDLIVNSTRDYHTLRELLLTIGFQSIKPTPGLERTDLSDSLMRGDYRIDLFETKVCGCLQLSDNMISRCIERYSKDGLTLYSCSPEDVFLFKSVTEREGDAEDSMNLLRTNTFRWGDLLDEINNQMTLGDASWISMTTERILSMEGFTIPIRDSVKELELKYMEKWADQFEKNHIGNE